MLKNFLLVCLMLTSSLSQATNTEIPIESLEKEAIAMFSSEFLQVFKRVVSERKYSDSNKASGAAVIAFASIMATAAYEIDDPVDKANPRDKESPFLFEDEAIRTEFERFESDRKDEVGLNYSSLYANTPMIGFKWVIAPFKPGKTSTLKYLKKKWGLSKRFLYLATLWQYRFKLTTEIEAKEKSERYAKFLAKARSDMQLEIDYFRKILKRIYNGNPDASEVDADFRSVMENAKKKDSKNLWLLELETFFERCKTLHPKKIS